jgi:hypothetical protein
MYFININKSLLLSVVNHVFCIINVQVLYDTETKREPKRFFNGYK